MDIESKVLLLGVLKKQESETLLDVVYKLEQSGVFSLKDGKKLLKNLKSEGFITDTSLSIKGQAQANIVENEFKL